MPNKAIRTLSAACLLKFAAQRKPPLHLPVGADAVQLVEQHHNLRRTHFYSGNYEVAQTLITVELCKTLQSAAITYGHERSTVTGNDIRSAA